MKNKTKIVTFFILFFTGVGFGVWGMFLPPVGEISSSVLLLIAQIFVLCSGIWGMEVHLDLEKRKFDVGVRKEDDEDEKDN